MRRASLRRLTGSLAVLGLAAAVIVVVFWGSLRSLWDGATGQGIDETITNDTGHAITWKCTTGNRTMRPGETETLGFISSPEGDGCNYADSTQMCLNEYQPEPRQYVTASYAIKEWACT